MSKRPNILITIADDQRFDTISELGNPVIRTPHLDSMAQDGVSFTAAHHMGSTVPHVCAPSRAMLLTGRSLLHLPDTLVNGYGIEENPLPFLPQLLRENGYTTFGIGKWHNGKPAFARSFDGGAKIFFGGMCDHDRVPCHDFDPAGEYSKGKCYIADGFSTDIFADAAVEFIENYRDEKPFFLFVAFTAPHDPRTPLPEYSALYPPDQIPVPPNFLPCHPFDNGELQIRDEMLEALPRTPQVIQHHIADYYAMITHVDTAIGRIHQALALRGLSESTLAVHTADHGLALGQHGLMGKQNLYEHSIRVPLLLRGPNISRGERHDALCYQHDLFPTLCEAAELPVPDGNEFRSLWPLVRNPLARTWSTLFSAYRDCQRMIKDEQWKLIEYSVAGAQRFQLFNWRDDPYELNDSSHESAQGKLFFHLRDEL